MADDLQFLAERITSSCELQIRLAIEVANCREKIFRTQAAPVLSVNCSPGAGELLWLQAKIYAELARQAIECCGV